MGEAKIKKAQTFRVAVSGKQRQLLHRIFVFGSVSQLYQVAGDKREEKPTKKERDEHNRAWAALDLDDYESIRPTLPDNPNDMREARAADDEWQKLLDTTGKTVILTSENVRVIQDQLTAAHRVQGLINGRALRILGPFDDLLAECKDGKHALEIEEDDSTNKDASEASA